MRVARSLIVHVKYRTFNVPLRHQVDVLWVFIFYSLARSGLQRIKTLVPPPLVVHLNSCDSPLAFW